MRVFVVESDRFEKRPLFMAIVDALRERGFSGATVLKGIEGFGPRRRLHAAAAFDYSTDLPVLVEVAETDEKIRAVLPFLAKMIPNGLVTLEKIEMRAVGMTGQS